MASEELLREKRESLGLTLEVAEEETKIRRKYLEALERGDYGELPGRVYARAFLRTYARFLGLDSEAVLAGFEAAYPSREAEAESRAPAVTATAPRKRPALLRLLLVAGVVAGLFAFNAWYGGGAEGPEQVQRPPAAEQPGEPAETGGTVADPEPQVVDVPPAVPSDRVEVVLVVTERPSWIRVTVDGVDEFQGMASPGETLDFTGRESVTFRVGDAGAVEVHVNGENLGLVGDYGDVVDREFTVDG